MRLAREQDEALKKLAQSQAAAQAKLVDEYKRRIARARSSASSSSRPTCRAIPRSSSTSCCCRAARCSSVKIRKASGSRAVGQRGRARHPQGAAPAAAAAGLRVFKRIPGTQSQIPAQRISRASPRAPVAARRHAARARRNANGYNSAHENQQAASLVPRCRHSDLARAALRRRTPPSPSRSSATGASQFPIAIVPFRAEAGLRASGDTRHRRRSRAERAVQDGRRRRVEPPAVRAAGRQLPDLARARRGRGRDRVRGAAVRRALRRAVQADGRREAGAARGLCLHRGRRASCGSRRTGSPTSSTRS